MIQLIYPVKDSRAVEIESILIDFSLAHESHMSKKSTLKIIEGKVEYIGYESIIKYLEDLKGELHKWHFCNC